MAAETHRIKFYTDAHIPKQVARQLSSKGVDIIRCEDVDRKYDADEEHLKYAASQKRTVVTCDEDFFRWHAIWQQQGKFHAGIIFIKSEKQGVIGFIVKELQFLHEAIAAGAATLEEDIYNQVRTIG